MGGFMWALLETTNISWIFEQINKVMRQSCARSLIQGRKADYFL